MDNDDDNEDFTSEFEFEDLEMWDDYDEMDEIEDSDQEQNNVNILTINLIESVFSSYGWIMCGDIDSIKKSTHNIYQYKNCKYYGIIDNRIDIVNQQLIILDDLKIMFCDYEGKILAHCVTVIELNNLLTILK